MIIDTHAHYTQAPPQLDAYRGRQVSQQNKPRKGRLNISDEQIVASLSGKNLQQMTDRGIDRLIFSPRASGMGHDFGNELISRYWTETNNDLISRVCKLFPDRFVPAVGLLDDLEYVRRWPREHWQLAFQGNVHSLSPRDFETIEQALREAAAPDSGGGG